MDYKFLQLQIDKKKSKKKIQNNITPEFVVVYKLNLTEQSFLVLKKFKIILFISLYYLQ